MGVGVEEPGRQDLLVIGLDQLAGRLAARIALRCLQQRYPLDLLQDQQPPGGQAGNHIRYREPAEWRQHLPHPFDVGRLMPEIEFAPQR